MKMRSVLAILLTALVAASGIPAGASTGISADAIPPSATPAAASATPSWQTSAAGTRVDPRVLEDTAGGRTARFLVVLRDRAGERIAARGVTTWEAQGQAVYAGLREAAAAAQAPVAARLDALGARHRAYYVVDLLAVEGDRAVVDAMSVRPDVEAVVSDRPFRVPLEMPAADGAGVSGAAGPLPDPSASATPEWNVSRIGAPDLWAQGFSGQGIVIASGDTGVDWTHPALQPSYRGWNGASADHNYNWWDAIHEPLQDGGNECGYNTAAPCDDYDHGTHTTGIAVGHGTPAQIGVAPGARWIACRNMDNGVGRPSSYIECLQFFLAPWDQQHGPPNPAGDPSRRPHVINNSYGCPVGEGCIDPHVLQTALDNLRAAGIAVVASAGNRGWECGTTTDPPGIESGVITVGASDAADQMASFSSRGPVMVDGSERRKPDLVAPGSGILSSVPGGYGEMSGTSMAAPHVAGAVALLWSARPALARNVDLTEWLLERSAAPVDSGEACGGIPSHGRPNNIFGYGRIDVPAAYALATSAPPPTATLTITGTVWADANRNRVRDAGEPGLADARLRLLHNGRAVAETVSGADGSYALPPAPAGFYDLQEFPPAGWDPGTPASIRIETYAGATQATFGNSFGGFGIWLPQLLHDSGSAASAQSPRE